jgi:hypothetical protein
MSETTNNVQVEELVDLYNGDVALRSECFKFSIGQYDDQWYHKDDEDIITLPSGSVCHQDDSDDISHTTCGDAFHSDEQEDCDIVWCDYDELYAYQDDCEYGYVSRRQEGYFLRDDNEDWLECNGEYYRNPDVAAYNDIYYYDSVNEYRHIDDAPDDDDDDDDEYLNGYHSGSRSWRVSSNTAWTMGFEVEKEDKDVRRSCYYHDLPHNWTKERDGSLSDSSGFELISPVYNLFDVLHEQDIAASNLLRNHINAKHSKACGGHIHIGSKLYTTEQIFEGISGFLPVLYSLYTNRLDVSYCKAKKKHEYLNRDKYSAVYVRDTTVEFRIFPAVKSVDNLMWRIELLRIMVRNFGKSERDVLTMLCDRKSFLHEHMLKVIDADKMLQKVALFVKYSSIYNDTNLDDQSTDIN